MAPARNTHCSCGEPLPETRSVHCSDRCARRVARSKERARAREARKILETTEPPARSKRRGESYHRFERLGFGAKLYRQQMTRQEAAKALSVSVEHVTRMFAAYLEDEAKKADSFEWEMDGNHRQMLGPFRDSSYFECRQWSVAPPQLEGGPGDFYDIKDWAVALHTAAPAEFDWFLNDLVKRFTKFRDTFFRTNRGQQFITKGFHRDWIRLILKMMLLGGEGMILAPPRHGKSELLQHFSIWLICGHPNIRIAWVSVGQERAKETLKAIREQLATNEELQDAYLAPDESWVPAFRSGAPWSSTNFDVGTRTVTGIKASTLIALGRTSSLLSLDCDLIVCDDIEDEKSTSEPAIRERTRDKVITALDSRNEEDTALMFIGSRQDLDDLYGYLLDDPSLEVIVNQAHDPSCLKDDWRPELHIDCMLFPEVRSYKWLMRKRSKAKALRRLHIWEMVYQNNPTPEGGQRFTKEIIAPALNKSRIMGDRRAVPSNVLLVAGLDPSSTGYQAGWLWAVDTASFTLYMLAAENREGGGIVEADEIIRKWFRSYGCRHWFIESKGFQSAIIKDRSITEYANSHGINLEPYETGAEKWDPTYGLTSMIRLYTSDPPKIDLPYGDGPSEEMVEAYIRQLVNLNPRNRSGRGHLSDLAMASWFPMKYLYDLEWQIHDTMEFTNQMPETGVFADIDWTEAPW